MCCKGFLKIESSEFVKCSQHHEFLIRSQFSLFFGFDTHLIQLYYTQKLQVFTTWWQEMSKVEKNATVEVKVVKVEDDGGEFQTQVQKSSQRISLSPIFQGGKKKKQQGGRSRNNSAGDKKYEKDRGRFVRSLKWVQIHKWYSRNSSAGDKKYERENGRGQGQGGGKRQGGKEDKPRFRLSS